MVCVECVWYAVCMCVWLVCGKCVVSVVCSMCVVCICVCVVCGMYVWVGGVGSVVCIVCVCVWYGMRYVCVGVWYLAGGRAVPRGANDPCRGPTDARVIPLLQTLHVEIPRVSPALARSDQRVFRGIVGFIAHVADELLSVGDALLVVRDSVRLVARVSMASQQPFFRTLGPLLHLLLLHFVSSQGGQFVPLVSQINRLVGSRLGYIHRISSGC